MKVYQKGADRKNTFLDFKYVSDKNIIKIHFFYKVLLNRVFYISYDKNYFYNNTPLWRRRELAIHLGVF